MMLTGRLNAVVLLWLCVLQLCVSVVVVSGGSTSSGLGSIKQDDWLSLDTSCISGSRTNPNPGESVQQQAARVHAEFSCFLTRNPWIKQRYQHLEQAIFLRVVVGPQSTGKSATLALLVGLLLSCTCDGTCTRVCSFAHALPECHAKSVNRQPVIELVHPLLSKVSLPADAQLINGRRVALNVLDALEVDQKIQQLLAQTGTFESECVEKRVYMCDNSVMPSYIVDTIGLIGQGQSNSEEVIRYTKHLLQKYVGPNDLVMITHRLMMDANASPITAVLPAFYNAATKSYPFKVALLLTFANQDLPLKIRDKKLPKVHSYRQLREHFCEPIMESINAPLDGPCVFASGSSIDTRQFLDFAKVEGFDGAMRELLKSAQTNHQELLKALLSLEAEPGFKTSVHEREEFHAHHVGVAPLIEFAEKEQQRTFIENSAAMQRAIADMLQVYDAIGKREDEALEASSQTVTGELLADFVEYFTEIYSAIIGGPNLHHDHPMDMKNDQFKKLQDKEENFYPFWINSTSASMLDDVSFLADNSSRTKCRTEYGCDIPQYPPASVDLGLGNGFATDYDQKRMHSILSSIPDERLNKRYPGAIARLKAIAKLLVAQIYGLQAETIYAKDMQTIFTAGGSSDVQTWLHGRTASGMRKFFEGMSSYLSHAAAALFHDSAEKAFEYIWRYEPRFMPFLDAHAPAIKQVLQEHFYGLVYITTRHRYREQGTQLSVGALHLLILLQQHFASRLTYNAELQTSFEKAHRRTPQHMHAEAYAAATATDKHSLHCEPVVKKDFHDPSKVDSVLGYIGLGRKTADLSKAGGSLQEYWEKQRRHDQTDDDIKQHVELAGMAQRFSFAEKGAPRFSAEELYGGFISASSNPLGIDQLPPLHENEVYHQEDMLLINYHVQRHTQSVSQPYLTYTFIDLYHSLGEQMLKMQTTNHTMALASGIMRQVLQTVIDSERKKNGQPPLRNAGTWEAKHSPKANAHQINQTNSKTAATMSSYEPLLAGMQEWDHKKLLSALRTGVFQKPISIWNELTAMPGQLQTRAMHKANIEKALDAISALRPFQSRLSAAAAHIAHATLNLPFA